jgi:hypothetical protein
MAVLLMLFLVVGFLILVPLLIVGLVLKLAFALVLIPFKVAGLAIRLALLLVFGVVALILAGTAVILIPLLPILFLAAGIWLIVRLTRRPHPAAGLAA